MSWSFGSVVHLCKHTQYYHHISLVEKLCDVLKFIIHYRIVLCLGLVRYFYCCIRVRTLLSLAE